MKVVRASITSSFKRRTSDNLHKYPYVLPDHSPIIQKKARLHAVPDRYRCSKIKDWRRNSPGPVNNFSSKRKREEEEAEGEFFIKETQGLTE